MLKVAISLLAVALAGCSSVSRIPHMEDHRLAKWNFRYRKEEAGKDEWLMYDRIDKAFVGDCEDFAFTLQNLIDGEVHYTVLDSDGSAHAILIKDGFVYENMRERPYKVEDFKGRIVYEMKFNGNVTEVR